jgi:hypothetical protein
MTLRGVRSAVKHPFTEPQVLVGTAGKPESMRGLGEWRGVNTLPPTTKPTWSPPHNNTHAFLPFPFHTRTPPHHHTTHQQIALWRGVACTVQYSTAQHSTVQYSTVQYSTVHYTTLYYIITLFITLHENPQYSNFNKCLIKLKKRRPLPEKPH